MSAYVDKHFLGGLAGGVTGAVDGGDAGDVVAL